MQEVVLAVPFGTYTPGIVRKRTGDLCFTAHVRTGGGVILTDFRPHGNNVEGTTVVAGRLPPGAEQVVVIDDAGDEYGDAIVREGVWLMVCGEPGFSEPLVRYTDAAGALVPVPLPPGERRPVADATDPCPVCGEVAWVELEGVCCERCGLHMAASMAIVSFAYDEGGGGDDEADAEREAVSVAWARQLQAALANVAFPVYAVAGMRPTVAGWSGHPGIRSVHVAHAVDPALLLVDSSIERDEWTPPRDRLVGMLQRHGSEPDLSAAALQVRFAHSDRDARRRAVRAEVGERHFTIDGAAEPFTFAGAEDAWVGVRDHYGVEVVIQARGVEPETVVLERLADLTDPGAGTTQGPAPDVSARRHAAAGQLLSRAEVATLIDACGLGEHREAVLGGVLAGYRLEPGGEGRTRVGGLPDLAEGEAWPHSADGIPYTFVAQIDCAALPRLPEDFAGPPWQHDGALVRIFAELVPDPAGPAVALACPRGTPVRRATLPPGPDPGDALRELHETPVCAVPCLTSKLAFYVLGDRDREAHETHETFARRLAAGGAEPTRRTWGNGDMQLLGHVETMQGADPRHAGSSLHRDVGDLDAWRVLINIDDGYPDLSFGDGGALAIVAPVADLAAGHYDRLVTEATMG